MTPRATYRLQFTPEFGFDDAARLAPYLAKLGVSHLYASPYLKARPGSQHGYDIVDHNRLNPELGGEEAFTGMTASLKQHGLGQILDFVPNHMGVGGSDNPFWLDVLEWGPDSVHAGWFDIDWQNDRTYLQGKLLVPVLGDQYGVELANGQLRLAFDRKTGSFAVWAYDTHKLPIWPHHYGRILGNEHPVLERIGDNFAAMASWRPQIRARADSLKAELTARVHDDPGVARALEEALARFAGQPGDLASWQRLEDLIRAQNWRAAHFTVASDDINYRRFFNINDLAGLRMELPEVFDHAHRLVFRLMREGVIDGLRIDHIDGLFDPKAYLERLRAVAPGAETAGPEESGFYLVVEKILAHGEELRRDWPVEGTTGYEVTNLLLGLMIDPGSEAAFTEIYADFVGAGAEYSKILRECKKRIMDNEMASELDRLARSAARVARQTPSTEDFTQTVLRRALREIVACFSVYRTYVDAENPPIDEDRTRLAEAIAAARPNETAIDASVYDFLGRLLIGDLVAEPRSGFSRNAVLRCAMKLQQYSGPVMAKGLEDTAFYRYNRFVALNEVGGHPDLFGIGMDEFHAANLRRRELSPDAMLTTSTHDTKRGEDVRARLAVLSEFPDLWAEQVAAWSALLRPDAPRLDPEAAPDRNDEYLLYQTMLGTWPTDLMGASPGQEALAAYAERLKGAMTKAMREAKAHTTWASPNETYETATLAFIDHALVGEAAAAFLPAFAPVAERIARLGVSNSIVQSVLKLTIPGMPDIYQGCEMWDLSMVDPDNRRRVDFDQRQRRLAEVQAASAEDPGRAMADYLRDWPDGRIKLAVMAVLLGFRRDHEALFGRGSYEPIEVGGPRASEICAFLRRGPGGADGDSIIVAVRRFPARHAAAAEDPGPALTPPAGAPAHGWRDLLSGRTYEAWGDLKAGDLFGLLPAAVLVPA